MPSSNSENENPRKPNSLTHTGQTTSETIQSCLGESQKNLVGSNYYAQNLFAQPYENGFQFISLNQGFSQKNASFEAPLFNEMDKHTTIDFEAEEEPFQMDDLETLDT